MLTSSLRRNSGFRSFQDFQQRLLYALAAHIPSDGHIFTLPRDLVYFIDIDNTPLGFFFFSFRSLDQPEHDGLHVVAHITGFRHACRVGNGKGHLQDPGQGLRQIGFAASRGPQQQDIALLQLHVLFPLFPVDPLVVIVYGNAQGALRPFLPDDILIQDRLHLCGQRQFFHFRLLYAAVAVHELFILQNIIAQGNAFVADIDVRTGHQPFHHVLGLAAEGAPRPLAVHASVIVCHVRILTSPVFRGAGKSRQ